MIGAQSASVQLPSRCVTASTISSVTCNNYHGMIDEISLYAVSPAVNVTELASTGAFMGANQRMNELDVASPWRVLSLLTFDSALSLLWQPDDITSQAPQLFTYPTTIEV